jgi:glutamate 5-kinase
MRTVLVKLGSSIVAHSDGSLRADVLGRICDAIAALHAGGDRCVLVSSGAIARGVQVMGLPARPSAIPELQAASAVGQGKLYAAYDALLRERGLTSAQVLLTAGDLGARAQYLNARHTLRQLLDWGVLAVVNENDTTATDEISFGDNDFLAAQVATLVAADLLVLLTDIDGLHSADPRIDPTAALIEDVHDVSDLQRLDIGDSTSPLGSGGMRSKVLAAEIAGAAGIPAVICNGTLPGALETVLAGGRAGTLFHPGTTRRSAFKLWLRYAKPGRGTLVVDVGAARALRERGTSLLPVGVVEVLGDFEAGDAVDIVVQGDRARAREEGGSGGVEDMGGLGGSEDRLEDGGGLGGLEDGLEDVGGSGGVGDGELGLAPGEGEGDVFFSEAIRGRARDTALTVIAKGISSYSATELRRVKGLQSEAVRELLPYADEEVVHRDRLVLA